MTPPLAIPRTAADDAFDAHVALIQAELRDPTLKANEHWRALRDAAYARLRAALEAV